MPARANTAVAGTLNSNAGVTGVAIDLYNSPTAYPGASRQARYWVGRVTGLATDAGGNVSWNLSVPGPLGFLSATATDSAGNTSEISAVAVADTDGDTVPDSLDCAPLNNAAWALPTAAQNLRLNGKPQTTFNWSPPASLGGTAVQYDLQRSSLPGNFTGAVLVGANLPATTVQDGGELPAPGASFFYLAKAKNGCGGGP